jgi:hypothetical protein
MAALSARRLGTWLVTARMTMDLGIAAPVLRESNQAWTISPVNATSQLKCWREKMHFVSEMRHILVPESISINTTKFR